MARIQEQVQKTKEKKEFAKNATFWVFLAFVVAALAAAVILIILYFTNKDKPAEEKTFDETYPSAELIDFTDLENILDNDVMSSYAKGVIYIYVYSPDYDAYDPDGEGALVATGAREDVKQAVNNAITANASTTKDVAFYVINILSENNKSYSGSVLTDNSIDMTDGAALIVIKPSSSGVSVSEQYTTKGEIINVLADATIALQ